MSLLFLAIQKMLLLRIKRGEYNFYQNIEAFRIIQEKQAIRESLGDGPLSGKQLNKIRNDLRTGLYTRIYGPVVNFRVLDEIEKNFELRIRIWVEITIGPNTSRRKSIALQWESEKRVGSYVDLFTKSFDPYVNRSFDDFSLILDLQKFLRTKKYDPKNNPSRKRKMTIFQCLVTMKHQTLWGSAFESKVLEYEQIWGKNSFALSENRKFYQCFGFGLQIWNKRREDGVVIVSKAFDSLWKNKIVIEIENFNANKTILLSNPVLFLPGKDSLHLFECTTPKCFYGNSRYDRIQKHIMTCRPDTKIKYQQKRYEKPENKIRQSLYDEGFLPSVDYEAEAFLVWDIETLMNRVEERSDMSKHQLVSIGLAISMSPTAEIENIFLYRKAMTPEALKTLIEEFVGELVKTRERVYQNLPDEIKNGIAHFNILRFSRDFRKLSPSEKNTIVEKSKLLSRFQQLICLSWNGGKVA